MDVFLKPQCERGTDLEDNLPMANTGPIENHLIEPLVIGIVVSPGHRYWVKKGELPMQHDAVFQKRAELIAGRGIRGDRYFEKRRNHKGQVTFMSMEAIDEIRLQFDLPDLSISVFRRNLIVSRINLAALVGKQFEIQNVRFEGTQECSPCRWMDQVIGDGAKAFMQKNFRGGLRAIVLSDGFISVKRGP